MTVSWVELGRPQEPGRYQLGNTMVTVRQDEIDLWREHPSGLFHLVRLPSAASYGLGAFEVPEAR